MQRLLPTQLPLMHAKPLSIPDLLLIQPQIYSDERGFFFESFNQEKFNNLLGKNIHFVQDNHSCSCKSVLRGLHYQVNEPQGKLIRVASGVIYDVAVDIRRTSPHFGHWVGVELSAAQHTQLWIPEGFAHGFLVLSETAEILYKTTRYYAPQYEQSILWNDRKLNISWPIEGPPILSEKDKAGHPFESAPKFET